MFLVFFTSVLEKNQIFLHAHFIYSEQILFDLMQTFFSLCPCWILWRICGETAAAKCFVQTLMTLQWTVALLSSAMVCVWLPGRRHKAAAIRHNPSSDMRRPSPPHTHTCTHLQNLERLVAFALQALCGANVGEIPALK